MIKLYRNIFFLFLISTSSAFAETDSFHCLLANQLIPSFKAGLIHSYRAIKGERQPDGGWEVEIIKDEWYLSDKKLSSDFMSYDGLAHLISSPKGDKGDWELVGVDSKTCTYKDKLDNKIQLMKQSVIKEICDKYNLYFREF